MEPYYQDSHVTIYHSDCLALLPLLGSVDHVITDPPYEKEAHTSSRRTRAINEDRADSAAIEFAAIDWYTRSKVAYHIARICNRWALVFCQAEAIYLWREDMQIAGFVYRRPMIWVKPNGSPQFSGDGPAMGYESIALGHSVRERRRWNAGGKRGVYTANTKPNMPHPTTKPQKLMRQLILDFTDQGDLILDPFGGSGSTAQACKALGRRCIMIEKEKKWCDLAAGLVEATQTELIYTQGYIPPTKPTAEQWRLL